VLVGSNAAWCHPILYQRMRAAKKARGTRIVTIDPRRTASSEDADLHLGIAPDSDTILFNGLLAYLAAHGGLDRAFIARHSLGFDEALVAAQADTPSLEEVARRTRLEPQAVEQFYRWFAANPRTVTCYSQGVNQSRAGTDKVNAIINCHLATGRIGRAGMGPFSLTGQPNAMGGREVGGLSNQLAAHMGFDETARERVQRFWNAPAMAHHEGLKAVQMFDAIATGRIRAVWIMATNPAASLPDAARVAKALDRCELVIVSDCVAANDTIAHADIKLPAAAWGEKDGTVTNSERRISRQRAFLPAAGEAKPDWWIVSEVAKRMGFADEFSYSSAADIFREHAALSAYENGGTRDFDIGGLSALDSDAYDALEPVQWPIRANETTGSPRLFADGGFFTPDRRACFVPVRTEAVRTPALYPLTLNTGRLRDQWHTMTRTGKSAALSQHVSEPVLKLNPFDARRFAITDGGFAVVRSPWGRAVYKAEVSEDQPIGSVFAPIHWSRDTSSHGAAAAVANPACDPLSGQPALKATPVMLRPVAFRYRGFCLSRRPLTFPEGVHWSRMRQDHCWSYAIAANAPPDGNWNLWARALFGCEPDNLATFTDPRAGTYRFAALADRRIDACLFLERGGTTPSLHALKDLFASPALDRLPRRLMMAGAATTGLSDPGPIVCACFAVGLTALVEGITKRKLTTVEDIGKHLKAGTNCGSCQPELRHVLRRVTAEVPA
jgi:assimilatory nitrate reductase catalytic subunit